MSYTIEIQSTDGTGTFSAYVAEPASGKGPALVICQEIFGVNETMRQVADRYVEEGYVAIVPDLFWRLEPGVELDYSPEGWEKAFGFFNNFDQDVGTQDIAATLRDAPICAIHSRKAEMAISRPMMMRAANTSARCRCTSTSTLAQTRNLSATGSRKAPKAEVWLSLRAR